MDMTDLGYTWLALRKSGYELHGVHGHVVHSDWNESISDMAPNCRAKSQMISYCESYRNRDYMNKMFPQ